MTDKEYIYKPGLKLGPNADKIVIMHEQGGHNHILYMDGHLNDEKKKARSIFEDVDEK